MLSTLDHIFSGDLDATLTQAEEAAAIQAARDGDERAFVTLVSAYGRALRAVVSRYATVLGDDEAQAEALAAFVEIVQTFDETKGERLAGIVADRLTRALSGAALAASHPFSIPERTLRRFYGILRRADGDVTRAVELAPTFEMTRETFLAVLGILRSSESLDELARGGEPGPDASPRGVVAYAIDGEPLPDAVADAEDRVLVEAAFRAVGDLEEDVCRLAYGFTDYDPVPDAEIAVRMGMSRPKIQRVRSGALDTMREALGL